MSGSIHKRHDGKAYFVNWYDKPTKKAYRITRYKGETIRHPAYAKKLLALIQSDYESYLAGLTPWRIEKYTGKGWTDVLEYFETWITEFIEPHRKPATIKGYRSYYRNWIKPFFEKHPVMLHEIQLDTLNTLLNSTKLTGKGKLNVMSCFHAFMDYAWRSNRIPEMPAFPKKETYNIVEPAINWLPEHRQMNIINTIPEGYRPIFLFLKYHLRRPGEACALHKIDYDIFNSVFIIKRSISARKLVQSTKTNKEHIIPCHSDFKDIADRLSQQPGQFMFINPRSRKNGRYTIESLNVLWKAACKKTGENIDMYSGLKHSSCSQYINEKGLSISELQMITDHARIESVARYAKVGVDRKKELMERASLQKYCKKDFDVI